MAMQSAVDYPVNFDLEEPESLSRWLWLFKWLLVIPHWIVFMVIGFIAWIVLFISWVAVIITGKYPRGLFNFMVGFQRWTMRVNVYIYHMTDSYPPFSMQEDDRHPVRLTAEYPERSNRLTAFFRWILVIPQAIIVGALGYALGLLALVNIVIVIFTGRPNPDIFKVMVGINRWTVRVNLYSYLVTDKYPPFSLD